MCLEIPQIPSLTKASTKLKPQGTSRSTYREHIRLARVHRPGATRVGAAPLHSLHGGRRSLLPRDTELTWPHLQCSVTECNTFAHFWGFFFFHSFPLPASTINWNLILKTAKSTDGKPRSQYLAIWRQFQYFKSN